MLLYIFQFKFSKNLFTADTGQVIVLDPPTQVAVKDDVVKNIGQTDVIPALRSGGEADTPFCPIWEEWRMSGVGRRRSKRSGPPKQGPGT